MYREFEPPTNQSSINNNDADKHYFNWFDYLPGTISSHIPNELQTHAVTYDSNSYVPTNVYQTLIPLVLNEETIFITNSTPIRPHTHTITYISTVYVPTTVYQTVAQLIPVGDTATVTVTVISS